MGTPDSGSMRLAARMYHAVVPVCSEAYTWPPSQSPSASYDAAMIPRLSAFGPLAWAEARSESQAAAWARSAASLLSSSASARWAVPSNHTPVRLPAQMLTPR